MGRLRKNFLVFKFLLEKHLDHYIHRSKKLYDYSFYSSHQSYFRYLLEVIIERYGASFLQNMINKMEYYEEIISHMRNISSFCKILIRNRIFPIFLTYVHNDTEFVEYYNNYAIFNIFFATMYQNKTICENFIKHPYYDKRCWRIVGKYLNVNEKIFDTENIKGVADWIDVHD
jgi:hypothetical protein